MALSTNPFDTTIPNLSGKSLGNGLAVGPDGQLGQLVYTGGGQSIYNTIGTTPQKTSAFQLPAGSPQPTTTQSTTSQSAGSPQPTTTQSTTSQSAGSPQTFASAFAALSPQEQQTFMAKNPNLDMTTGLPKVTSMDSKNFNINPGPTIDSSSTNSGFTMADLLAALKNNQTSLLNGSATSSMIPSDSLYGQIVNNIFNASQYTPQEQAALQNYNDVANTTLQTQLAARRQLQQLQDNGTFTADQSGPILSELNRRSQAQLADLATQQSGNTLALQTLGLLRQNQLGAYQNIAQYLQPQQVAPGSTLYNPLTGVQYQGNGASPQTIFQTAQQLEQSAQQQGTLQYNSDGSVNHQAYIDQAQEYYNTHGLLNSGGAGTSFGGGSTGGGQQSYGNTYGGTQSSSPYQYALSKGLNPNLAGAVTQSPITGDYYISGDKVPPNTNTSQAGPSGIAYVPSSNVPNIQQLDIAIGQLQYLNKLVPQYLTPGLLGRLKGLTTNQIQTFLQSDPGWAKFNSVRLQAIDYLKGLAQGGGFRTTQSEIDTAANSIFNISDNLESAQSKMQTAMDNINRAYKEYLPTHTETPLDGISGGSSSQGGQSSGGGGWASLGG